MNYTSEDCATVFGCVRKSGKPEVVPLLANLSCTENAVCSVTEGERRCTCSDGFHGDGDSSCVENTGMRHIYVLIHTLKHIHTHTNTHIRT